MKAIPLGEFFAEKVSILDPKKFPDEDFELWSIPAYDEGAPAMAKGREIGSSKKCVAPHDVLLARIVPHIRRAWIVSSENEKRKIASGEWIVFRSKDVVPEYLRHFLLSDVFHSQLMLTVAGVGGSLLRARPDGVAKILIPLPSLDEQRRIAAILDQADALRRKRRAMLDRFTRLKWAIYYDLFGKSTEVSNWPVMRIADLAASTQYGTSAKAAASGEFPILRMGNITYDGDWALGDLKYIDLAPRDVEKYTVRAGDILFNRTNSPDLVGKTAVFREGVPFAFAGYLVRLRLNDLAHPDYVSAYLNSKHGKATLRGMCKSIIGMANINAKELGTIEIAVPPIERQRIFAERIAAIRDESQKHIFDLGKLNLLFASLQHRAFNGQL